MQEIELAEGLILWKAGAHTVTSIEVQALRLWLLQAATLAKRAGPWGAVLEDFMRRSANVTDEELAVQIMAAKETELQAGRAPMSMDPIRQ